MAYLTKSIQIPDPDYVESLERDNASMRTALTSIRYMNRGPNRGSAQWQLDTAISLAENTLLAVENSKSGKVVPEPEVLQGVKDGRFIEEARRILNAIDNAISADSLDSFTDPKQTNKVPLDQSVINIIRLLETTHKRYNESLKTNEALREQYKVDIKAYQQEIAELEDLVVKYESVFQDIYATVAKVIG